MRVRTRLLLSAGVLVALFVMRWLDRKYIFPAHTRNNNMVSLAAGLLQ